LEKPPAIPEESMSEDLTLEMNKVRQASITQELAEISGGVEAMK
jgi:F0F1-type ATP synthase gamma subunit